jgi:hypothetical protein
MLLTSACHEDIVDAGGSSGESRAVSWNLASISTLAGLIVASLVIIGKITGGFAWVWKKVVAPSLSSAALLDVPNRTLILVPNGAPGAFRYSLDFGDKGLAMRAVCELKATNVCQRPVQLVAARIRKPATHGAILVRSAEGWGEPREGHAIPSGETQNVRLEFLNEPALWPKRGSFKADIGLTDQFDNEHWLRRVRFEQVPAGRISGRRVA